VFCPRFQVMLGGEAKVFRRHKGVREAFRDLYGALDWMKPDVLEVRDLGDQIVALGRLSIRGKGSGAETESPAGWVVEFKDGKAIRVREYLDDGRAPRPGRRDRAAIEPVDRAAARGVRSLRKEGHWL
jgi:hypothetical protein